MSKEEIIQTIVNYLRKHRVKEVSIFGPFARDEITPESDIDICVKYSRGTTLLDIAGMELELSEKLGMEVDLVDKEAVKPRLMDYIQKDLQILYP